VTVLPESPPVSVPPVSLCSNRSYVSASFPSSSDSLYLSQYRIPFANLPSLPFLILRATSAQLHMFIYPSHRALPLDRISSSCSNMATVFSSLLTQNFFPLLTQIQLLFLVYQK
jgi:hypothetical protein